MKGFHDKLFTGLLLVSICVCSHLYRPLWVYSLRKIYGWIWINVQYNTLEVFWILRQGWFISAYLCVFNYKCLAPLRSMTAPLVIMVIYLWAVLAGYRNLIGWERGSSSRWRLQNVTTGQTRNWKDHNHVLSSNYRRREKNDNTWW